MTDVRRANRIERLRSVPAISCRQFGWSPSGAQVHLYTLRNSAGLTARIMTYGGILQSLEVPDRDGTSENVTLGFSDVDGYVHDGEPYFGALIGRYANRIAGARFVLDGREFKLTHKRGAACLHGGVRGFDKHVWSADWWRSGDEVSLVLSHRSPAGDQGFPGSLRTEVTYTVTSEPELRIEYRAGTDEPTVLNLTNHAYFNLGGEGSGDVLGHELTIHADRYLPIDSNMIPTGELVAVGGTPMDFRRPRSIGERIADGYDQLVLAHGYDHNFVLNRPEASPLAPAASLLDPRSGRLLEIQTSEPGIQLYVGNLLDGTLVGTSGKRYQRFAGVALETQHFPDSPNQAHFPSTVLRPGETYKSITRLLFSSQ